MSNSDNEQSSRGSITLALPDASKGGLLQEPSHPSTRSVASSPHSVDKPSAELITSTDTSPVFVRATSTSQDLAPGTQSQTGHTSGLGSPNPIDTSSATSFSSTKSQLSPMQSPPGNLSTTVNPSAPIPTTTSLPFPSSSTATSFSSTKSQLPPTQSPPGNLSTTVNPSAPIPTTTSLLFPSSSTATSFSSTKSQLPPTQSPPGNLSPTVNSSAPIPATASLPFPSSSQSLNLSKGTSTPFLVTSSQTSIVTIPSLGGSTTDAFPSDTYDRKVLAAPLLTNNLPNPTSADNLPNPTSTVNLPNPTLPSPAITSASVTAYTSELSPELSSPPLFNTTLPDGEISTSLPSKTITIWAPTSTVTTSPTKSLDTIIGASIAAGVALLCVLSFGLYLIRRKYKKATYHYNPAHDIAHSSEGSTSAFLNVHEPLDALEKQGGNMTSSATIFSERQRTTTPNLYPGSYASHAQISTSTFDTTLPQREEGDNNVENVHSRGSSFGEENYYDYYNSVLEYFSLPFSESAWSDHLGHNVRADSNIGSLEAPGTRPLSRVLKEFDPSVQIGIAI